MAVRYCVNTADYLLGDAARESVALVDSRGRYTYGDLRSAAGRLAAELAALNLPPGSRVGVLGPNSLFWVAAYLAVMKLGHVAVPFSDKLTPDDIRRNAGLVGCAAVFTDRRVLRTFTGAFDDGVKTLTDEVLRAGQEILWPPDTPVDPSADAILMFTSGSTARPKAVRGRTATSRRIRTRSSRSWNCAAMTGCWSSFRSFTATAPRCCTRTSGAGAGLSAQLVRLPRDGP